MIIFLYCANICLRKVVDSKILCLFTLVLRLVTYVTLQKMIGLHLAFFYQHNFIFHDLPKTNVRYFSIHWPI